MPDFLSGSSQGNLNNNIPVNNHNRRNKTRLIGFLALILLLVAIPITVVVSRLTQEVRQRASGVSPTPNPNFNVSPYTACGNSPTDIMLIIDRSGSMSSTLGAGSTKLAAAIAAAQKFVDIISTNTNNKIGLVTFSNTATLDSGLTSNFSSVKTAIGNIKASGNTCTECGAAMADQETHAHARPNIKRIVVLLTDGIANTVVGNPNNQVSATTAEQKAVAEIQNGHTNDQSTYFTIGLGNKNGNTETGINEAFLQKIATLTGGEYFYSPTTNQLDQIYQGISQIIGKGSITGNVFNDQNTNGNLDTGEPGLQNWVVNLKDATNANLIATTKSASDGAYIFTGICDQSYAVSEVVQTGWTQTSPPDPRYYKVTIANSNNETDKNFGNAQPTPTPTACLTPGAIQNVKITCTNCPSTSQ